MGAKDCFIEVEVHNADGTLDGGIEFVGPTWLRDFRAWAHGESIEARRTGDGRYLITTLVTERGVTRSRFDATIY